MSEQSPPDGPITPPVDPVEVQPTPEAAEPGRLSRIRQSLGELTLLQISDLNVEMLQGARDQMVRAVDTAQRVGGQIAREGVNFARFYGRLGRAAAGDAGEAIRRTARNIREWGRREGREDVTEREDEAGISLRGIGRFATLVRYYWREETLNGPTGNIGPWGRRNVPGLIQRDETYRRFADRARYGDVRGSENGDAVDPHEAAAQRKAEWVDGFWHDFQRTQEGTTPAEDPNESDEELDDDIEVENDGIFDPVDANLEDDADDEEAEDETPETVAPEQSQEELWDTFRSSLEDERNPHGVAHRRMPNPANDLFARTAASLHDRSLGLKGSTSVHTKTTGLPQFAKFEVPPRDPEIVHPVTWRERFLSNRRTQQGEKLSQRYARDYRFRRVFGDDIGLSPRELRDRVDEDGNPIPLEQADYFRRSDRRGHLFQNSGRKGFLRNQRRIHNGGRGLFRMAMGQERLERAARGDTIPGRRRTRKINRIQAAQTRDRARLGINE